jgi:4'-phosphopantetheinyl transferase
MNNHKQFLQEKINLSTEEIHVFLFQLDLFKYDDFFSCLSDDEVERANKLKVDDKKTQFVITRGVLRQLLSNVLDMSEKEIVFNYGEHNKPYLDCQYNNQSVEFNVSHSGNYALIALGLKDKLGVDIEMINNKVDYQSLSQRFFSNIERKSLLKINESEQLDTFYRIWTRKEAFIKATGKGVTFGLDRFSVPANVETVDIINIDKTDQDSEQWYCYDLVDNENYKTALVSSNKSKEIIFYQQVK